MSRCGTPSSPSFRWPSALGLLFRRTVRPALVVSFFWAFGVWFFGEGLGLIFTGSASALTGAPGSVFLYGLIGLMAWPRSARGRGRHRDGAKVGIASSAAGQGIGGAATPLLVWSGYWSLAAILFLLPEQPNPDIGLERDHGHVIGGAERLLALLEQLWQPVRQWRRLDDVAAWPSARSWSDSDPWSSADRLCSWPPVASCRRSSGSAVRASAASSPARGPTRTLDPSSCSWRWPWCRPRSRSGDLALPDSRLRCLSIPWRCWGA